MRPEMWKMVFQIRNLGQRVQGSVKDELKGTMPQGSTNGTSPVEEMRAKKKKEQRQEYNLRLR